MDAKREGLGERDAGTKRRGGVTALMLRYRPW